MRHVGKQHPARTKVQLEFLTSRRHPGYVCFMRLSNGCKTCIARHERPASNIGILERSERRLGRSERLMHDGALRAF